MRTSVNWGQHTEVCAISHQLANSAPKSYASLHGEDPTHFDFAKAAFWGFSCIEPLPSSIEWIASAWLPRDGISAPFWWLHWTQISSKKWTVGRWSAVWESLVLLNFLLSAGPDLWRVRLDVSPTEKDIFMLSSPPMKIFKGTSKLRKLCLRQSSGTGWPSGILVVSELRSNLRRPVLGALQCQSQLLPSQNAPRMHFVPFFLCSVWMLILRAGYND